MAIPAIPIIDGVISIVKNVVGGVRDHFEGKRKLKKAIMDAKIKLAYDAQQHNQDWEMKQLDNAGWKDDVLFYSWIFFFIYSGFYPESAAEIIQNWEMLPDWFLKIFFWLVAAVLGIKKLGDTLPGLINGMRKK